MSVIKKIALSVAIFVVAGIIYKFAETYVRYEKLTNEYVINKVEGHVTVQNKRGANRNAKNQGGAERNAKNHDMLKNGDVIKTDGNSKADLVFKDTGAVRVTDSTVFEVDKDGHDLDPRTKLAKGAVFVKITKRLTENQSGRIKNVFSVTTPQAVAGVRGTSFWVRFNDEVPKSFTEVVVGTEVAVLEGTVSFSALGSTVETDVTKDKKALLDHFSTTPRLLSLTPDDEKQLEEIADIDTALKFSDFLFSEIIDTFIALICPMVTKITATELSIMESAIIRYNYEHKDYMPGKLRDLQIKKRDLCDSCGVPYLYKKLSPYKAEIRSAGADMEFFTDDDLVRTFSSR